MSEERRCKILVLDYEHVIRLFMGLLDIGDVFLPDDARVVAVHDEWRRNGLSFIIWSASFDVVEDGYMIPALGPVPMRLRGAVR